MVIGIVGKFAKLNSDEYIEYGINKDDTVLIAGSGYAPVDEDDNYKLLFVIAKFEDGKVIEPGITARRNVLDILPEEESEALRKQFEESQAQQG